jgi:hypothetical protein
MLQSSGRPDCAGNRFFWNVVAYLPDCTTHYIPWGIFQSICCMAKLVIVVHRLLLGEHKCSELRHWLGHCRRDVCLQKARGSELCSLALCFSPASHRRSWRCCHTVPVGCGAQCSSDRWLGLCSEYSRITRKRIRNEISCSKCRLAFPLSWEYLKPRFSLIWQSSNNKPILKLPVAVFYLLFHTNVILLELTANVRFMQFYTFWCFSTTDCLWDLVVFVPKFRF